MTFMVVIFINLPSKTFKEKSLPPALNKEKEKLPNSEASIKIVVTSVVMHNLWSIEVSYNGDPDQTLSDFKIRRSKNSKTTKLRKVQSSPQWGEWIYEWVWIKRVVISRPCQLSVYRLKIAFYIYRGFQRAEFPVSLSNHVGFTPWLLYSSTHHSPEGFIHPETSWAQDAWLQWLLENWYCHLDTNRWLLTTDAYFLCIWIMQLRESSVLHSIRMLVLIQPFR